MTAILGLPITTTTYVPTDLDDQSVSAVGSGSQTASYTVSNDGRARDHNGSILDTWLISGSASAYDVRATVSDTNGSPSGTFNSWLNLATSRTWSITDSVSDIDPAQATLLIELSFAGQATAVDSATITLTATRV